MKIKQAFDCDKVFFTSDTHFGHSNIIKYCNRPFKNAEEMNQALVDNWNKVVPPDGIVFHLGDFAFRTTNSAIKHIIESLNGQIYITWGNHDREKQIRKALCKKLIVEADLLEITVKDDELVDDYQKVVMCHYPLLAWHGNHRGYWQFFGHCHGNVESNKPVQIDVGVDVTNFTPLSWQDAKTIITKRALKR